MLCHAKALSSLFYWFDQVLLPPSEQHVCVSGDQSELG